MKKYISSAIIGLFLSAFAVHAEPLNPTQKAHAEKRLEELKALGSDATIVAAVKDANGKVSDAEKAMTQDKWKGTTIFDPMIKGYMSNDLAKYLQSKKAEDVTECFVSRADGTKVAFLSKTSNWSHKGKPKHDLPMEGKTWIGESEKDDSTGKIQVQVSFPVMDAGKAIGSIVVGLDISKL